MPTQLMQHLHMGPEDAIKAHYDLGCPKLSVGIHWGTFMMSDEHYLAPRQVLEAVWKKHSPPVIQDEAIVEEEGDDITSITSSSSSSSTLISDNSNHKNRATATANSTAFITTAFGQTITIDNK